MRILMLIASLLMVGSGAFCIANANVTFLSVSIVVGIAVFALGVAELITGETRKIHTTERGKAWIRVEAVVAIVLGIVFLSGQLGDDHSASAVFALWTTIEGLKSVSSLHFNYKINTTIENVSQLFGLTAAVLGIYMFFNSIAFNIPVLILIGLSLVLIGINCFKRSLQIEYKKSEFLSDARNKLEEAKRDERFAMDKAKEAIAERNEARERIEKYTIEVTREEAMINSVEDRRRSKKNRRGQRL